MYQQEYPHGGEWSWAGEYPTFPYHTESYPISTQTTSWQMGYPHYQPYPEFQSNEFSPSTYSPDNSSHYPSFPSHPYQACLSKAGDHFPTWSDEDWQAQDTHYYQDQTCSDQRQYQPQPRRSFEPPLEENHYANSTEGGIERLNTSQQSVRDCTRSNVELVMKMQHVHND